MTESVRLLAEVVRDGVRQDNRDTVAAALTSLSDIHRAYVSRMRFVRLDDHVIQALRDGLVQAWELALEVHADQEVLDAFAETITRLCRDAAAYVPREPRVVVDIAWLWMGVAHDWFKDAVERHLMYTLAPMIILGGAAETLQSLSELIGWEGGGTIDSLVELYLSGTIPLVMAKY